MTVLAANQGASGQIAANNLVAWQRNGAGSIVFNQEAVGNFASNNALARNDGHGVVIGRQVAIGNVTADNNISLMFNPGSREAFSQTAIGGHRATNNINQRVFDPVTFDASQVAISGGLAANSAVRTGIQQSGTLSQVAVGGHTAVNSGELRGFGSASLAANQVAVSNGTSANSLTLVS